MILEFKFRNFRSAKDWQILSFEASADKVSEEYYCTTINDTKVLKLGILYGANASGKTNVLLALDFIRKIAISPKINKMQPIGFTPFLLDDTTKKECGVFELTFFVNNMKHLYYLEVDNSAVLKETLKYYPGKQPAEIFSRETINGITHIRLGSKVKLNVAEQEKLQVNTLSNMSVVSAYATANFMFPELERVYNYFLKQWLPILLPQTDLKTWTTGEMEAEKENKSFLLDLLHRADFNISGFDVQQNEKNKKDTDLIFEHTIVANGTSSVHYLPDILESAGTMRYYGLGTILNILLERNAIIPVDELENSLHPDLFAHFINLFLVNSTYSQLIFSTHNLQSLDTEDLRKDVVWFTEKKDDGSTDLFSLDDFNIRNGVSFLNAYNAGKFGAKPTLGGIFISKKRYTVSPLHHNLLKESFSAVFWTSILRALSPMPPSTSLPAGSKGSTTKSRPCGARVMAIQTMITSSSSSSMSAESLTSGILHPTMFMIDPKFSWNYVRTCYARSYISRSA